MPCPIENSKTRSPPDSRGSEHLGLLVTDRTRAPEPWLAFTGHTLVVGDMGRTELASAPEEDARALFERARRLASLPT